MITIVPTDSVVVIDGQAAFGVDMSSVNPDIHAIQFNPANSKGYIEYKADPETGVIPPHEEINDCDFWEPQISQAQRIIFCKNNPKTFYSTVAPLGRPVIVTEEDWPQPPDTTDTEPPTQPAPNTELYWDGDNFVWSAFPIDLDLAAAKAFMVSEIDKGAYRILLPSDWLVTRSQEVGTPIPADWGTWRQTIRNEATEKKTETNACSSFNDLSAYTQSEGYLTWTNPPA